MNKIEALAKFLNIEETEIKNGYDNNNFETEQGEFLVLTDEEAEDKTSEEIKELLWAFNTDFILDHSNLENYTEKTLKAFQTMQSELCENANEIVKAIIIDLDEFISDAVEADGRGHFLSGYDGEEIEEGEYYIYRTN